MDPDNSYREEAPVSMASRSADDENDSNPSGRSSSESAFLKTRGRYLKIATWNVRTLYQPGKFENLIHEMQNVNLDILGIAETHWTEEGKIIQENHTVIYSGGEKHRNGVGIVMKNSVAKSMMGFWAISDRVIMMKLEAKPFNINVMQVYAPTQDHDGEEIEQFYQEIQNGIKYAKSDEVICLMGDLNAKVGDERYQNIVGMHGLGRRNERGERLIQFCQENKLIIANTWFQQPVRKLYTWKSPGDKSRNQIDYIMLNERFRNCIKQAETYPGADINSDHNPVVVKINMKLKRTNATKRSEQLELNLLKEETYKSKYNVEVQNIYERLCIEETEQQPDNGSFNNQCHQKWTTVKQSIKSSLNTVLPRKANRKKRKWMTDHILNLMENRKQFKNSDKDEYNRLNKQINLACKEAKEKWLVNKCEEVEQLEKQYKSREMHNKVKELTSKNTKKKASGCIKDKNGNILFNQEEIAARWVEYITELYEDHREQMRKFEVTSGASIMKEEIQKALKSMKDRKADELPAEALKALDEHNIEIITSLCNIISSDVMQMTVLLPEGPMFLQALLTAVNEKGKPYGMEMNIIKTKSMVISRKKPAPKISISVEGKPIQQVDRMVYLGYMATEDGKCDKEIKRIGIARTAFESMPKILISRNISIELRSRIAKCYIWSTLLYGAETWTLTKVTSDKLEAFEMWLNRRMLRISWKEHKTNADVLHKMKTKRSLLNTIKKRKCQYFGHLIRRDGVQRLLMEGRINSRRGRGRPRTTWTDNIKEWTKISYNDCIRVAQDRERWRSMTADLLTTDGT